MVDTLGHLHVRLLLLFLARLWTLWATHAGVTFFATTGKSALG